LTLPLSRCSFAIDGSGKGNLKGKEYGMDFRQEKLDSIRVRNYDKDGNLLSDETMDVAAELARKRAEQNIRYGFDSAHFEAKAKRTLGVAEKYPEAFKSQEGQALLASAKRRLSK
jgi:hypothetical protein